jgi:hypothetical protein
VSPFEDLFSPLKTFSAGAAPAAVAAVAVHIRRFRMSGGTAPINYALINVTGQIVALAVL